MLEQLRAQIESSVRRSCEDAQHRDAMVRVLSRPGFALHPEGPCRAGVLTVEAYRAIVGSVADEVILGAAGVEMQMEAAYMFDGVADGEEESRDELSPAEELALAITLLYCGSSATIEAIGLAKIGQARLLPLLELHRGYIGACGGQYLDARLGYRDHASSEESLRMTKLKSGSLGKGAGGFGASLATDDPELIRGFEELGWNLFTYAQLIDDLRDAFPTHGPWRDWDQSKKTLPLVFLKNAVRGVQQEDRSPSDIIATLAHAETGSPWNPSLAGDAHGAKIFAAVVAEAFLNRAKRDLEDLRTRLSGTVEPLEQLISGLEITVEGLAPAS